MTTPQDLDTRLRSAVRGLAGGPPREPGAPVREGATLTGARALALLDAQLTSRHLDLAARWLRSFGEGFHTIGSAGHEGNAAVAEATRVTDPALLHYRSGAFYCARAAGADDTDPVRDVLRGIVASAYEPIAGGRHKVFGHQRLHVIPTMSTIASHLPRAVGLGYALTRARRAGPGRAVAAPGLRPPQQPGAWPEDAVVVCSFGDATVNHASATAAFNTTGWCDHIGLRLPVLFVCEDNAAGISARPPVGWVATTLRSRPGLRYFAADGCDLVDTYEAAVAAVAFVRRHRRPAVLHLSMVRLMGHAGTDAEVGHRTATEIAADLARDPVVGTARLLVGAGLVTADQVLARYDEIGWQVRKVADEVLGEPRLASAAEVTAPLAPHQPVRVARFLSDVSETATGSGATARADAFGGELPEHAGPLTLAQTVNATLTDAMLSHPGLLLFGPDVAVTGGRYGVTKGLRDRFGAARVFDTLLDETSILGLALGFVQRGRSDPEGAATGPLPVPEIHYPGYLHRAGDQLRGEAATLRFFSQGAYRNPMVVRVPGLAYQGAAGREAAPGADHEGFGGHVHDDNSMAVLRDIPGLVIAVPARAEDAAPVLRTCLASAAVDGSVCVFLEPIALYHTRDLHVDGDGQWLAPYLAPGQWEAGHVPIGRARVYSGAAEDLTIITYGNGVRLSLRAAAALAEEGVGARVVDLRWLAPLPVADMTREAAGTGRVLVVDETRRSGGVGEGVLAALVDAGFVGVARRVAAVDSYLPLGPAAGEVLVDVPAVIAAARATFAR